MWERLEVGGVFWHVAMYPDGDFGLYECGTKIALLSAIPTNFWLLYYACNKEMQMSVGTGIVYRWKWLNEIHVLISRCHNLITND